MAVIGQIPNPKYMLPSVPYGSSTATSALNVSQPPQQVTGGSLPSNYLNQGQQPAQQTQQAVNPFANGPVGAIGGGNSFPGNGLYPFGNPLNQRFNF